MRRIEESVLIDAPREVAWRMFTDLTCWADWNSVLTGVRTAPDASLAGGEGFFCRLQPFGFPIPFAVRVELADAPSRLLWVAERWGVRGRHWFLFTDQEAARAATASKTSPAQRLRSPGRSSRRGASGS